MSKIEGSSLAFTPWFFNVQNPSFTYLVMWNVQVPSSRNNITKWYKTAQQPEIPCSMAKRAAGRQRPWRGIDESWTNLNCSKKKHFLQFVRLISKHRPAVLGAQKITKNTCPKLVAFIVPWIFGLCDSDSLQAVFVKAVAGAEENADGAAQQRQYRSQRRDGLQSPRSCQWAATVWICSTWKDEVCIAPLNKKLRRNRRFVGPFAQELSIFTMVFNYPCIHMYSISSLLTWISLYCMSFQTYIINTLSKTKILFKKNEHKANKKNTLNKNI